MNILRSSLEKLAAQAGRPAPGRDPWRPGFHLTPAAGWLNDPNGLCFFRGEYHVFYQYSPFHPEGGLKFWGHLKSRDLLTWERLPVMLCPDTPFDLHGVYSGSALCGEDGLYLYYTGNVKYEGDYDYIRDGRESNTMLAFSPDGARLAWKRPLLRAGDYPPGLTRHIRDPKVWEQDGRYYMIQGARTLEDQGEALIFESPDGLRWAHVNTIRTPSPFGYMWECPDLFAVDGQQVLLTCPQGVKGRGPGFENEYACGYFPLSGDFRSGCALGEFVPLDYGFDFYAPQTFTDGKRRLLIGWMGMPDADYTNPTAAQGWQHCLTVPREVRFENGALRTWPVRELESLREEARTFAFSPGTAAALPPSADIEIHFQGNLSLELSGVSLEIWDSTLTLEIRRGGCGRTVRTAPVGKAERLRLLADVSALEIFVNGGETVLSARWYPQEAQRLLTLEGSGEVTVYQMRPLSIQECPAF